MKSQITMKDMAEHFGVSLNTIHKAIAGKPGVSQATRKKILEYAEANEYQLNAMASILKRKKLTIAVCLPQLDEDNRYFYYDIWRGCRNYLREWESLNIQTREIAFQNGELSRILSVLAGEYEQEPSLDGLLTVPPRDEAGMKAVKTLTEKGVAVVFVTEDNGKCSRLGAVIGDYYAAGQLMAEQICNILKTDSRICLMAGDEYNDAHYMVAKGFHEYIRRSGCGHRVFNLYGYYETELLDEKILDILKEDPPDAILSVFARGSAVLYKALKTSNMAGRIPVIANDIFPESVEALKDGAFTNLIFKDPYRQAYLAMKMLCEYLVKDLRPKETVRKVEISLIFRSNLKYYEALC